MLIIAGTVDVDPAQREAYLSHADVAAQATLQEDGCFDYVFTADRLDPGRIRIYERWRDFDCVKAHLKSDHIAAYREAVADLVVKNRSFTSYEVTNERALG